MLRSKYAAPLFLIALLTASGCSLTDIEKGECTEGQTKCMDNNIYKCSEAGRWSETPFNDCGDLGCEEGMQADDDSLSCYKCKENEVKCEGDILNTCNNHTWQKKACEYGCNSDQCNECNPNETKCEDGVIYTCADGKWDEASKNKCEFGCMNGLRADDGSVSCYECQENDAKCEGKNIHKCLGHTWVPTKDCEFGCFEKSDTKPKDVLCKECIDDNKKYYNNDKYQCVEQICKSGFYEDNGNPSQNSCTSDFRQVGECRTGTPKCEENILKICIDGAWKNFGNCDTSNPCSFMGEVGCYDSIIGIQCIKDNTSEDNPLKACDNNSSCNLQNECASCQSGTTKCKPGSKNKILQACINGVYNEENETRCPQATHCEDNNGKAQCIPHICEIDEQRCGEDNMIETCKNYNWEITKKCDNNYEACRLGICQRKSCTEDSSICPGNTKCKTGECYNQGENYPLICDDSRVMDMWLNHYDVVDKILHHGELTDCEIYASIQEVIKEDGSKLCNKISYCGNPNSLENCIHILILNLMADSSIIPDGYNHDLDIASVVTILEYLEKDHSSCQNSCLDDPSICSKYQQCNSKGECVRKPCSLDKEICGEKYQCINDVCVRNTCDIDPSICGNLYCNTKTKECYKEDCGDDGEDCTKKIAFCSNKAVTNLFYENFAYLDAIARGDEQCEAFEELSFIFNTEGNAICESIPYCSLGSETSWFTCLADYVVDVYLGKQPAPEKYKDAVSMSLANTITNYKLGAICK